MQRCVRDGYATLRALGRGAPCPEDAAAQRAGEWRAGPRDACGGVVRAGRECRSGLDGGGAVELRLLRGALEREGRRGAGGDGRGDAVEEAGADLALVARGRIALGLHLELALLQLDVRGHAVLGVA